ncbi:MAG TPA: virulence-associated E family protein [Acidithiobacillus sp.]|nr:virulence-associated E family protein [Acidithiobacillus sp.]
MSANEQDVGFLAKHTKPKTSKVVPLPVFSPGLDLALNEDGSVKSSLTNVAEILEKSPDYAGKLKINSFSNEMFYNGNIFRDHEATECCVSISRKYYASFKLQDVKAVLPAVCVRHAFHPVQEYLKSLVWDRTPRVDLWLEDAFEVPPTPYTQAIAKNVLIGAVARVMRPGCKMDNMMVLEGGQGIGKTSAVRALAGAEWYAEVTEAAGSKDFYQCLRGKWFVEFGDLAGMRHTEINKLKQVLSSPADNYRASYAASAKDHPRHNIFIGTTNEYTYLGDSTGARRFWSVSCAVSNVGYIINMRDQLWAEAMARFSAGESWHEVPHDEAEEEQEKRFDADSWEYPVARWLSAHQTDNITTGYILADCLGIDIGKHSKADQTRVGAILRRLGFISKQRIVEGVRGRFYEKRRQCTTS